jgi:hypothetical protein
MLIQQTPITSLTPDQVQRLRQAASGLLQTNEAALGYVMWEGKYFSTAAVRSLAGDNRQFLREVL